MGIALLLFFCIFMSGSVVIDAVSTSLNRERYGYNTTLLQLAIAAGLWSWLFYLLH